MVLVRGPDRWPQILPAILQVASSARPNVHGSYVVSIGHMHKGACMFTVVTKWGWLGTTPSTTKVIEDSKRENLKLGEKHGGQIEKNITKLFL